MAKKRARGSVDNERRLKAFGKSIDSAEADWHGCDPKRLQAVVVGITRLGGAVTIGLTRNMGAYFLTLLLGGDRETLYFNGDADLDDELLKVLGHLDQME